jgi:hypothetical protein
MQSEGENTNKTHQIVAQLDRVFVTGKHFQASLMFEAVANNSRLSEYGFVMDRT